MTACVITFLIVLVPIVAILKFESVEVEHYVKVEVKARKIIDILKGWFRK